MGNLLKTQSLHCWFPVKNVPCETIPKLSGAYMRTP
eukprot:UN01677